MHKYETTMIDGEIVSLEAENLLHLIYIIYGGIRLKNGGVAKQDSIENILVCY